MDVWGILLFIFIMIIVLCLWILVYDSNRFVVVNYEFKNDRVKKPVSFLFLSDLHGKEYGKNNQFLLDKIRDLSPDMILVGGDMIKAIPGAKTDRVSSFMTQISKIAPIYYAMGNHEYRAKIYPENYKTMYPDYMDSLKDTSICFLDNESVYIEDTGVLVAGLTLDKKYYKRFQKRYPEDAHVKDLLGQPREDAFQILMAHNPEYLKDYSDWKPDLVLSGHVYGGVARLPFWGGVISPSLHLFPHYDGGRFDEYGTTMILSRGLGMHTIPVRFYNPGEIIRVTLQPDMEMN